MTIAKADSGKRTMPPVLSNPRAVFGGGIVIVLLLVAAFADVLAPYSYKAQDLTALNEPSSALHLLGTDEFGRDVLSRIIHGARISVVVGFVSVALSALIGATIGGIAGYFGGWLDSLITNIADTVWSFPTILISMLLVAIMGNGLEIVIVAIALSYWAQYVRLMRAQVMSLKGEVFVEACRSLGASDWNILFRQIAPNALAPIIVTATIGIGNAIVLEATLSFLGMGAQPPSPSWGAMMSGGAVYLFVSPGVVVYPGLAMFLCVVGFNLLGDAVVDSMNVRGREVSP